MLSLFEHVIIWYQQNYVIFSKVLFLFTENEEENENVK